MYYFKGAKILAPLSITSNEPVFDVDTISLSKQRASQGAQRWELSFKTVSSGATEADIFVGMVTGISSAETMIMPQLPSVVAVPIYPQLRTAVTTSHTFLTSNSTSSAVTLSYYRDVSNLRGLTFTDGILSSTGSINLVEAVT